MRVRSLLGVSFVAAAGLIIVPRASGANPQDQQFALAAAGAVKLVVKGQGWFHVGQPALMAAGLPADADPAKLQLFADGVEQAIEVIGNGDTTFSPDEAIEFYGTGRDTLWTDAHTYWLVAGSSGARVPVEVPPAGGLAPANFARAQRVVERNIYVAAVLNGDKSNFFSAAISSTPTMQTIAAQHLDTSALGSVVLRVSLQGISATEHQIDVSLNGQLLGTCMLDPTADKTFTFAATNAIEGDNQITLTAQGASDYSALESVELDYPHTYAADGDQLVFTAPASTHVAITGFSTPGARVVDVTDPVHPTELTVTTPAAGTVVVDTLADVGPRTLYAFTSQTLSAPASVLADSPSSWSTSHDGDLLILSHSSFLSALAPLVAKRAQDGWKVQLVDLQDVYDEFGAGDKTIVAIRDFVQWTSAHWRVPPRFVLLVGDATFDPRNFLGKGDFDFAPTKLIDTAAMETSSDDWFVDADLDGVPELAIGRMPVRTQDQATTVVQKTLAYRGASDLSQGGLFVSDQNGVGLDFEAASAMSAAEVSGIMPTSSFLRSDPASTSAALLAKLNAGPFLVSYFGHGSVEVWDGLFSSDQAATLTNAASSIYVAMNCLNGFFQDLYTTSLAEALLEAPKGGAVAVWASSTLADFTPQPAYSQAFLMRLTRTSLGEAAVAAKQAITDLDMRRTWMIFGDPTLFGAPAAFPDGGTDALDAGGSRALDGAAPTDGANTDAVAEAGVDAETDAGPSGDGGAMVDVASRDAATPDASTGSDGHGSAGSPGGCGCDVDAGGRPGSGLGLILLALALAAARGRGRRARGARRWPGLFALAVVWLAQTSSAHASYGYRKSLDIQRAQIGTSSGATTLTNYPLLISMTDASLKSAANGGHVQNANGYDIAFTGADSTTCGGPSSCTFNYEIEQYVATTGQIVAWVQIPTLKTAANAADTVIYIKYGDASISSPTQNMNGTWDGNFKGVWHLAQNPGGSAPQMTDSTSTSANATANGAPAPSAVASAQIGPGVSTSGTTGTGYFDMTNSAAFSWAAADTLTFSGWFKTTDSYGPLFSERGNSGTGNPVVDITVGFDGVTTNAGDLEVLVRDDTGVTYAEVIGTSCNDGNWHLFTVTRNSGTITVYLDGSVQGSATGSGATSTITTSLRDLGREGNWVASGYGNTDEQYLAGSFDEYRISKTLRSVDWITTDYSTQKTPGSTFTEGGEALASCGNGVIDAGEQCDDGNIVSGDGCSTTCTIESGWTCAGQPSVCHTTCGDGIVAGTEQCDDGNTMSGDGCSGTCTVEAGYHCTGSPSVCTVGVFEYYKTITVNKAQVGTGSAPTTLSNYPILFSVVDSSLRTTANGGRVQSNNGYDIIFQGRDAATCNGPTSCQLPHEIERYDPTTGTLVAWVSVPALNTQKAASSTSFRILFDNQAIASASSVTTSVWDSNFQAVWHLNQSPGGAAPQMTDSTANGNNGTSTSLTQVTSSQIGYGVSTDGSTSYMSFNPGASLNVASSGAFTYSVWVNTSDTFGAILSLRDSASGNAVIDIMVGYDGTTTSSGSLLALVRDDGGGTAGEVNGGAINNGAWHFVTLTRSSSTITLYLDGVSKGTSADAGGSITTDTRNMGREGYWTVDAPGYTTAGNEFLAATFDEARASNAARSIDWITTDYNAQSSPSTFITYTTGPAGEVATTTMSQPTITTTDVEITRFDAADLCVGASLSWQTAYEIDTLGFNVYRQVGATRASINPTLIPAVGLSGGGGHAYLAFDPGDHDSRRSYLLERIGLDLRSTWYGPAIPAPASGCWSAALAAPVGAGGGSGSPTPLASPAPSGEPAGETGGCSIPDRGGDGPTGLLAIGLIALALRRRSR
jgi:cysteine-rich repeat protein